MDRQLNSLLEELSKIDMKTMLDELNIDTEELIKELNINMDKMLQELSKLQDI